MSTEREVISIKKDGSTSVGPLTEEQVLATESREEKKARLARVLERGIVIDRAVVELPSHLHGEWCHKDAIEVDRMRLLGFWVDGEGGREKYAGDRGLHSDGDGTPTIGDVIFMVCEAETKELIEEVRAEQYEKMHGKPGSDAKTQREEQGFRQAVAGLPTPIIEESHARSVKKSELETILNKE